MHRTATNTWAAADSGRRVQDDHARIANAKILGVWCRESDPAKRHLHAWLLTLDSPSNEDILLHVSPSLLKSLCGARYHLLGIKCEGFSDHSRSMVYEALGRLSALSAFLSPSPSLPSRFENQGVIVDYTGVQGSRRRRTCGRFQPGGRGKGWRRVDDALRCARNRIGRTRGVDLQQTPRRILRIRK